MANDQDKQLPQTKAGVPLAPVHDDSEFAQLLDSDRFAQVQRIAKLFSESDLVPETFRGKPANCAVALQMAFRLRVDPLLLMQSIYIVHGRPGMESKLIIALVNSRGPFEGPLQWKEEGEGDARSWTCYATHRKTGERCESTVTWAMVKAEAWDTKTGSKWKTIPSQMGRYRSAAFLARLYCPEVILGLPAADELEDVGPRLVGGERLNGAERNAISMPSSIYRAPDLYDLETGEILPPETPQKAAQTGQDALGAQHEPAQQQSPQPGPETAQTSILTPANEPGRPELAFGADAGRATIERALTDDPMAAKRLASKAQRDMLTAIAMRHRGMTTEGLDKLMVDRFGVPLDSLPMNRVNSAVEAINAQGKP